MKFTVSTTWEDSYLDELNKLNKKNHNIDEVWGSLRTSVVGSGRPSFIIPEVNVEQAKKHIDLAHSYGFKFNYLANALCMGNLEYDTETHKKLLEYFGLIEELGSDIVTITIPYLIEIVKKQFPRLKIKVSVINQINSLNKIKFYEELGADIITLDSNSTNRDFAFLRSAIMAAKAKLELLPIEACLYSCPFRTYHYLNSAHASQPTSLQGWYMDYCIVSCLIIKYSRPVELIKSNWIRPEDLQEYEKIGYDKFKLGQRVMSSSWNLRHATAYSDQKYNGDLFEILSGTQNGVLDKKLDPLPEMPRDKWEILSSSFLRMGSMPSGLYLDNRDMDGFIDFYKEPHTESEINTYCEDITRKFVKVTSKEDRANFLRNLRVFKDMLTTSAVFLMPMPAQAGGPPSGAQRER